MKKINEVKMIIPAKSVNEGFARAALGAFVSLCDPTVEELSDIKTAVSEAVTNCIVHAYKEKGGTIDLSAVLYDNDTVKIRIKDKGCGITDVNAAMQPLFTTAGDERSGLGFSVMQSFSDALKVASVPGKGTRVTIIKRMHKKGEV